MDYVKSYRELEVYKLSRKLSIDIYMLTKFFPKEETYALTDQIRRSSRSLGAQIAEAWAKRKYEKHFTSKLTDADGEQLETQHWIETALDCGLISEKKAEDLLKSYSIIGKMINSMIAKSEIFCRQNPITLKVSIKYFQSDYWLLNTDYSYPLLSPKSPSKQDKGNKHN